MAFFEQEFPTAVSYKATGGPSFSTTVNQGFSGFEQRNKNWAKARGKWSVNLITPPEFAGTEEDYIGLVQAFFLVVGGKADGFRLKDWLDYKFADEQIGVGDGSSLGPYQLIKTYTMGSRSYVRTILKPITSGVNDYKGNALADSVSVKVDGVIVSPTLYDVSPTAGTVTFHSGHPPTNLKVITASGQFHIPVRFDSDDLPLAAEESAVKDGHPVMSWGITLVEVRL